MHRNAGSAWKDEEYIEEHRSAQKRMEGVEKKSEEEDADQGVRAQRGILLF